MALDPSNGSNLEQLVLKGLNAIILFKCNSITDQLRLQLNTIVTVELNKC